MCLARGYGARCTEARSGTREAVVRGAAAAVRKLGRAGAITVRFGWTREGGRGEAEGGGEGGSMGKGLRHKRGEGRRFE